MALKEYKPGTAFTGRVGRTIGESEPAWPAPLRAKEGAPNVLFIVLDDTGFGQLGCYGSPINTPNINRLAENGLRYTNMHTTALCSPTRSCILTGRNHHYHVPKEWADKYKGKFDNGWDKYREKVFAKQKEMGIMPQNATLSRHDPDVQDWANLPAEERKLYARMIEVFAGFLEHTDHHIGRLINFLESTGELDNTLIMLISDNGASAEGGPTGSINENKFFNNVPDDLKQNLAALNDLGGPKYFNHYAWGWTHAGNTPFKRWKRETYRGGVSDPFIVHWPKGIKAKDEIRAQYAHAIDIAPTALECLGIEPPEQIRGVTQSPIEGVSFAHTFNDARAESKHHTQYFEMMSNRSIYHDDGRDRWRAVCPFPGPSFTEAKASFGEVALTDEKLREYDAKRWELYNLGDDPAETKNLADTHRDVLIEMIALWYAEAGKYKVFPLDSRGTARFAEQRPQLTEDRKTYVYYPHTQGVPENVAVKTLNRAFSLTAEVEIPKGGAEGVIICHGGNTGGYTFFIKDKKLHYVHNYVGAEEFHVESKEEVTEGKVELRFEFEPTGQPDITKGKGAPGRAQLYINGKLVGQAEFPVTVPLAIGIGGGLSVGRNPGAPVSQRYHPPFAFTGKIHKVTADVSGKMIQDKEEERKAQAKAMMARQ